MASKLSPREIDLMATVVNTGQITVSDWNAIAKTAKYSTAKYARDTWTTIKKKLAADMPQADDEATGDNDNDGVPAPKKPAARKKKATPAAAASGKRKAKAVKEPEKAAADDDDDDDDSELEQPLTKKRAARAPKKAVKSVVKVEKEEANDDADEDNEVGVKEELVESGIFGGEFGGQLAIGMADASSLAEAGSDDEV